MTDITPDWPDYSGPKIHLEWRNSVAVATAADPGGATWVLVPLDWLGPVAVVAELAGERELADEARDLVIRADPEMRYCSDCGWHPVNFGCYHEDAPCTDLAAQASQEHLAP
jgi:hypothetical protein